VAGLVGAILTLCVPRVGARMLGIAAIPSILFTFMGVGLFFGLGTLLLVIATVLAFIADAQVKAGQCVRCTASTYFAGCAGERSARESGGNT
jgi:hypothetical protein